jgi:hypothetical protein
MEVEFEPSQNSDMLVLRMVLGPGALFAAVISASAGILFLFSGSFYVGGFVVFSCSVMQCFCL